MYEHKLYCPKCEYQIIEKDPLDGEETFCQNCLAWSMIVDDGEKFYLKFIRYDFREKK